MASFSHAHAGIVKAASVTHMTHGAHHSAGSTLAPPSTLFTTPFKWRGTVVSVCRKETGQHSSSRRLFALLPGSVMPDSLPGHSEMVSPLSASDGVSLSSLGRM